MRQQAVQNDQRAAPRRELDAQPAHFEKRRAHRSFGFSASRNQSPSKLTDRAISTSITPLMATANDLAAFQSWLVTTYRTPQGTPLAKATAAEPGELAVAVASWPGHGDGPGVGAAFGEPFSRTFGHVSTRQPWAV